MNVLFFLEDPGSVGFISDVLVDLKKSDINLHIMAKNYAVKMLQDKNIDFEEPESEKSIEDFIKNKDIKLILTGTSQNVNSLGLFLIDFAKIKKINVISFVDSSADSELRFMGNSDNPLCHKPDWLLVPDQNTKDIYIKLGFSETNILISGSPNYEKISSLKGKMEKKGMPHYRKKLFNKELSSPLIIFVDEHSNDGDERLHKTEEYNFKGRRGLSNRNEVILGEILDILKELEIRNHLVVRLHPKSDETDYSSLISEINDFNSGGDPHELIFSADLVIGMTSVLLMEAHLLGKRVISILPKDSEKEWAPPGLIDNLECVSNVKDLELQIKNALSNDKNKLEPISYNKNSPKENVRNFISNLISDSGNN